jgi:hypothetical protein
VIGVFNEQAHEHALEERVASWGHAIAGRAERPHGRHEEMRYRAFWIDS